MGPCNCAHTRETAESCQAKSWAADDLHQENKVTTVFMEIKAISPSAATSICHPKSSGISAPFTKAPPEAVVPELAGGMSDSYLLLSSRILQLGEDSAQVSLSHV